MQPEHERREERHEEHHEERRGDHLDHHEERRDEHPVFHPGRPTKILISPGHGAGWITWAPKNANDNFLVWMLTHEPLIRGLEKREHKERLEEIHKEFHHEAHVKFGIERIVCARVEDLVVHEVHRAFQVLDHDGSEWVEDVVREGVGRVIAMGANVL